MTRGDIAVHKVHKFVGKCIYCGSTENLHDEHCIPESLNGVRLLDKGSCGDCGRITSQFEGGYARDSMLPVRTAWNMKSKRSKKKRPTEFPMKFIKNGEETITNVPVEAHYSAVPMVEIGPPGEYATLRHAQGLKHGECQIKPFFIRPLEHIEYLKQKYNADDIGVDFHIDIFGFLRIIAKIAYCTTIWTYGLSAIAEAYVVPAILGTKNDILQWVGSDGKQETYYDSKHMNTDHMVETWHDEDGRLFARVKLFKKSFTPEYIVVVGQMKEGALGLYRSLGRK
ncbi:MAG: hypothetical protein ACJ754_18060 [Pyrinomonadaceae bacterium]